MFFQNTFSSNTNTLTVENTLLEFDSNPINKTFDTLFITESNETLNGLSITFHAYGKYIPGKTKVVWACHALTGNSDVFDWWPGLFGENDYFNPKDYFIICANVIGSSYGSTSSDHKDENGNLYLNNFPTVTPRDMARAHEILRTELGIEQIDILIGASLGGQQAVEWAIEQPSVFKQLILVATNARHSAYGIAYNETQRQAIYNDPTYGKGSIDDAKDGLKVARAIAMISYRSYQGYEITQTDEDLNKIDDFKASSYQRYQGQKLANRFNAYSYVTLSKAMDAHNVGRNKESIEAALAQITAKTLVIGIDSDNLFPVSEQIYLKEHIKGAKYIAISSAFGHDGFLVEGPKLKEIIDDFLVNDFRRFSPTTFKR
jgi:homoserine O-acetyltransferase